MKVYEAQIQALIRAAKKLREDGIAKEKSLEHWKFFQDGSYEQACAVAGVGQMYSDAREIDELIIALQAEAEQQPAIQIVGGNT